MIAPKLLLDVNGVLLSVGGVVGGGGLVVPEVIYLQGYATWWLHLC